MSLHPRGRKIFVNLNIASRNIIKVIDIESLNTIKTFSDNISDHPQKFVISPCGTYLFTTTQSGEIRSLNMITGAQEMELKPTFKLASKNFIRSLDFHPKDSYLCATIYGPNGGVALYEHDFNESPVDDFKIYERPVFDKNSRIVSGYNTNILSDIIKKIDNVFLNVTPFESKVDPLPVRKRYEILTTNDDTDAVENEILNQSNMTDDNETIDRISSHSQYDSSASDVVNRTYEIVRRQSSTNGEDSNGINTKTFSVSGHSNNSSKNRTFEIKPDGAEGSSTSVSENLE